MPIFRRVDKPEIDRETSVMLTPTGKAKAEDFALQGPKFDILACLLEDGTMSFGEISEKANMSVSKVREICKSLAVSGYIKPLKV